MALYSLVSRIRLLSSAPVVAAAEDFVKDIVRHYGEPNVTRDTLRANALSAKAGPLAVFSLACRQELRDILQCGQLSAAIRN